MRKPKEIEELIKRAIRDEIALFPLKSVAQVRNALYLKGYQSLRGELDWHYVARLMKKVRIENLAELSCQSRTERLINLKERHRVITKKIALILEEKDSSTMERLAAANSILKWDMAMFFAEELTPRLEVEQNETLLLYQRSTSTRLPHHRVGSFPKDSSVAQAKSRRKHLGLVLGAKDRPPVLTSQDTEETPPSYLD